MWLPSLLNPYEYLNNAILEINLAILSNIEGCNLSSPTSSKKGIQLRNFEKFFGRAILFCKSIYCQSKLGFRNVITLPLRHTSIAKQSSCSCACATLLLAVWAHPQMATADLASRYVQLWVLSVRISDFQRKLCFKWYFDSNHPGPCSSIKRNPLSLNDIWQRRVRPQVRFLSEELH